MIPQPASVEVYEGECPIAGAQLNTLQVMCDRYKNSIWFSGHSHRKWSLQQYEDKANIYRNPESGWSVHIPSCAKPIDSDGTSREDRYAQSEGTVINVYENHIDILGVDFISGKYLPIATYRLDTTLQEVEEKEEEVVLDETYLKASDFVWNPEKKPLEIQGVGTASITDVDGMPGYIDVIFTSVSQGFYMTNSTYTPGVASLRRLLISPSKICSAGLDGEQIVRPRKRRQRTSVPDVFILLGPAPDNHPNEGGCGILLKSYILQYTKKEGDLISRNMTFSQPLLCYKSIG